VNRLDARPRISSDAAIWKLVRMELPHHGIMNPIPNAVAVATN
jgi:hypothetical protein